MIAAELAKMTRSDAGRAGGRAAEATANLRLLPDAPARVSVQKAADMLNVGRGTVEAARKVIRKGVPELAGAVKAGDIAVSTAAELVRQPEEVQREVVAAPPDERVEKLKAMRAWAKDLCGPLS